MRNTRVLSILLSKEWAVLFTCFGVALFLTGCATNNFSKFYTGYSQDALTNLPPWSGHTSIFNSTDLPTDAKQLNRRGFTEIGQSSFRTAATQSESDILNQAKQVGADIVLYRTIYLGSEQTAVPYTDYTPGRTYTTTSSGTVNANAYGSGGYASGTGNYYGTATTTTPGTFSTQMVPVTLHFYNHNAVFFRTNWPSVLGVVAKPLSDDMRRKLKRNGGAEVLILINDSPAFRANILEGDIILRIDGEDIASPDEMVQIMHKHAAERVNIEIWRDGSAEVVPVQLNPLPIKRTVVQR
jgi:serine protease Do